MSESLLCGQIARYRKAAGMTQEELGRAVGVSTQAVSRWECGGTPDVALLPAIADRLGVSIDALFGRDGDAPQDMDRQFSQWLQAIPKDDRMMQIFRLLGTHLLHIYVDPNALLFSEGQQTVAETCYMRGVTPDGSLTWLRSQYVTEEGMVLSIITEDFPLYLLLPEPPEGYEVHFAANDDYRKLFAVLSQEGCLELLLFLYHKKFSYYTPIRPGQAGGPASGTGGGAAARLGGLPSAAGAVSGAGGRPNEGVLRPRQPWPGPLPLLRQMVHGGRRRLELQLGSPGTARSGAH